MNRKDLSSLSDEELIDLCRGKAHASKNDVEKAENLILERYKELVKKRARSYYLTSADQEDLLQEGMIGLYKAVKSFDQKQKVLFRTFALRCIDNQLLQAVRTSLRKKHQILNSAIPFSTYIADDEGDELSLEEVLGDPAQPLPEDVVTGRSEKDALMAHLSDSLSDLEKRVMALYVRGESYLGIASKLEISPKSSDNALQRIRKKIRLFMEEKHEEL